MIRGYKVKIYPNKTQEQILLRQVGACRYIYNHFLALKKDTYLQTGKNITYNVMSKELTKMRREIDWLSEVGSVPLQQSLRCLDVAFNRFFRKQTKFPHFHKKNDKQSMRKVYGWNIDGNKIKIANGLSVRFRGHFPEKRQGTLTISRDATGDWWASTLGEEKRKQPRLKKSILGVDMGIKTLATTSDGDKYENLHALNNRIRQIKKTSQNLSRKKKNSNRRYRAKKILAKLHQKVGFIRSNHLHHISKAIVSKNHAMIAVEDLAVANLMKNRRLSRSISDASWGELLRQIRYKQEWQGGKTITIDRFFPSSKTCSACHFVVSSLPLSVRNWRCGKCGTEHDRDINAAKMIAQQAACRLGAEGGEGSGRLRFAVRVARPVKRGGLEINHFTDLIS